jgi:hypothetical protein
MDKKEDCLKERVKKGIYLIGLSICISIMLFVIVNGMAFR